MKDQLIALGRPEAAKIITTWLTRLARMVRHQGQMSASERGAMIAEYCEMLLRTELPEAAFNLDALHYVADAVEWWPAYSTLRQKLEEHWAYKKTQLIDGRLPLLEVGGDYEPLSTADHVWINGWRREEFNHWARDGESRPDEQTIEKRRRVKLSLMRRHAPKAYQRITGKAANPGPNSDDWQCASSLKRTVQDLRDHPARAILMRVLQAAVKAKAPQHLHLVESKTNEQVTERMSV